MNGTLYRAPGTSVASKNQTRQSAWDNYTDATRKHVKSAFLSCNCTPCQEMRGWSADDPKKAGKALEMIGDLTQEQAPASSMAPDFEAEMTSGGKRNYCIPGGPMTLCGVVKYKHNGIKWQDCTEAQYVSGAAVCRHECIGACQHFDARDKAKKEKGGSK